jgi:putative ABC transport system permease protein
VVFSRQYRYSLNYEMGFQQQGILDVDLQGADPEQFRNKFSRIASVNSISMSSNVLGLSFKSVEVTSVDSRDSLDVAHIFCDDNYIKNLGLQLLAGTNFPSERFEREKYIVVNEQFVKSYKLGAPHDALGKLFLVDGKELEVIGVLRDFHYARLNLPVGAFFLRMDAAHFSIANMDVTFTDTFGSLTEMETLWKTLDPDSKFEAKFFDDEISDGYDSYKTLLKLVGFLGLLAISISLLGLLGMVTYTSETKVKEVGIRKVMGASTLSITLLLSSSYVKLMLLATALAIPLTTYITDKLLANMQYYHVTLNVWDIMLSLVILLMMGLATIASQTFKTAAINPAQTLRSE